VSSFTCGAKTSGSMSNFSSSNLGPNTWLRIRKREDSLWRNRHSRSVVTAFASLESRGFFSPRRKEPSSMKETPFACSMERAPRRASAESISSYSEGHSRVCKRRSWRLLSWRAWWVMATSGLLTDTIWGSSRRNASWRPFPSKCGLIFEAPKEAIEALAGRGFASPSKVGIQCTWDRVHVFCFGEHHPAVGPFREAQGHLEIGSKGTVAFHRAPGVNPGTSRFDGHPAQLSPDLGLFQLTFCLTRRGSRKRRAVSDAGDARVCSFRSRLPAEKATRPKVRMLQGGQSSA